MKSRHRFDAIFLVQTGILLVVYIPFITVAARLVMRPSTWRSVVLDQAVRFGPPGLALRVGVWRASGSSTAE